MIASLDELVLKCVEPASGAQIKEAVICYQGGAFRAAITTTYVAVCYDLIAKMRALAEAGDAEAASQVAKLDALQSTLEANNPQAINGLLAFERTLLELFRDKFDFFGTHEYEDLKRLRFDRNRCAHPGFAHDAQPYAPSAELARTHIWNAITLVLSQQPRQGKAAMASLMAVITSSNFPGTPEEVLLRLRGSELANARDALVRTFVDEMAFGWPNPDHPLSRKLAAVHSLIAVVEMHRAIAVPRAIAAMEKLLVRPEKLSAHFGGVIALRVPEAAAAASPSARTILRQWLLDPSTASRANALRWVTQVPWLVEVATEVAETLSAEEIARGTRPFSHLVIARAIHLFAQANSSYEASNVAEVALVPLLDLLSFAQVEEIFDAVAKKEAVLARSDGFRRIVERLSTNPLVDQDALSIALINRGLGDLIEPSSTNFVDDLLIGDVEA